MTGSGSSSVAPSATDARGDARTVRSRRRRSPPETASASGPLAERWRELRARTLVPISTYRLQLHREFGFADARRIVPYLERLGAGACYSSPFLTASPGSMHGYDIGDHNRLNPELGGEPGFEELSNALRAAGMPLVLDFVPNHMGIDPRSNPWWRDVLENGRASAYARYFDVDWDPLKPELRDKVLLPILGDLYGAVLDRGEIRLALDAGALVLRYFEHELPVNPSAAPAVLRHEIEALGAELGEEDSDFRELQSIATALGNLPPITADSPDAVAERRREKEMARDRLARLVESSPAIGRHLERALARWNGEPGSPESFDLLHDLLEAQAYRLAYWRTAFHEINYRRFFDINTLAGLRMEEPEVFDSTHGLVLRLLREGKLAALRLDHLDGLFDPAGYLERLEGAAGTIWVVAEKILSPGERMPERWRAAGTSGYDFLNDLNRLFVAPAGLPRLRRLYERLTGRRAPFAIDTYVCKKLITQTSMASELSVLAAALDRISEQRRRDRDLTLESLRDAIRETVACFPVYRTYLDAAGASPEDRATIERALREARRRNPATDRSVFDFLHDVVLPAPDAALPEEHARERLVFAMKLQQYTGPVHAKGVEDTAFYRSNVLVSLNEVGGEPERASSPAEFHATNVERFRDWPFAMLATTTHDTKRGEDARARLNVLSERVADWQAAVRAWLRANAAARTKTPAGPAPTRNDEYLFYQALVGAWPMRETESEIEALVPRLQEYMSKAIREAKLQTSWINANPEYEEAVSRFVEQALTGPGSPAFLGSFRRFHEPIAELGMVSSLAQVVLKLASPGVPDFYQGTELWDLSLVDPDNRRPVDFALRERWLGELAPLRDAARERDVSPEAAALLAERRDGRVKLWVTTAGLHLRRRLPDLFLEGEYLPLEPSEDGGGRIVAFARRLGARAVVAVAPRMVADRLSAAEMPVGGFWGDVSLPLPADLAGGGWWSALDGRTPGADQGRLAIAEVLGTLPVALLVRE